MFEADGAVSSYLVANRHSRMAEQGGVRMWLLVPRGLARADMDPSYQDLS